MQTSLSVLLTGASGAGKSSLIRGALDYYGSGIVVCCPGTDELDSYVGLSDQGEYLYGAFDDPFFQPTLSPPQWDAKGHQELILWLKQRYEELKSDVDSGKAPRYSVLGVDTISAVGRLAFNAALAKFKLTEPPAAISPNGASFYGYLRILLESSTRVMRAIRGLGVHWIVASHPTEAEANPIQQTGNAPSASKIMPDLPGGFKNHLPSYFTTVLDVNIRPGGVHYVKWGADPKRVTKSRLGELSNDGMITLPKGPKESWETIAKAIDLAKLRLTQAK